jgi:hypothetical protein
MQYVYKLSLAVAEQNTLHVAVKAILLKGFMKFDHMTKQYLYPDRYIKMISYFLIDDIHIFSNDCKDLVRTRIPIKTEKCI